jgi:hypothetical protein
MTREPVLRLFGIVGLAALAGGPGAWSQSTTEATCVAAKARAAARVLERVAACHADNLLAGGTAGPGCFVDALAGLEDALVRADAQGPCGGDHGFLAELAQSRCFAVPSVFDRCNAAKIRAVGKVAAGKVRCLGRNGGVVDPLCFARREARYRAAFVRAEGKGPCPGTPEHFAAIVDRCIDDFVIALACGNGRIDRGEQCDGQIFCTDRECRILSEIGCCQFGSPPSAICVDEFPELCFASGLQVVPGFCEGAPLPVACPDCKLGGCADPPIAPTSVCCDHGGTCEASSVATTVGLQNALLQCLGTSGQPVLGTCSPSGTCVP